MNSSISVWRKGACFPDCWKVSLMIPVFKNVGEGSTVKNYRSVSLLSVVIKVFEKLVNNRTADRLEKCGLFSDFQYSFRSSRSTVWLQIFLELYLIEFLGLLTGLIYPMPLTGFGMLVFFTNLRRNWISGQIFGPVSSFLSNRRLWVVLNGKSS